MNDREARLDRCEEVLGYRFRDRALLQLCLTHSSTARTRLESNERLEFLGDAVLGMFICERLFHQLPEAPEGELTRIKSALVSRTTCAELSEELGLPDLLFVGKGLVTREPLPTSVAAGVFESIVAGLYLDGGMEAAGRFLERLTAPELEKVLAPDDSRNFKSQLQQLAQKTDGATPVYHVLDEQGPDHSKCFQVAAVIGPRSYPAAWGASKKEAEQRAAQNALRELVGEAADEPH
ncbi:MAG: ribonuclease III [Planctomycetales bacterium]